MRKSRLTNQQLLDEALRYRTNAETADKFVSGEHNEKVYRERNEAMAEIFEELFDHRTGQ